MDDHSSSQVKEAPRPQEDAPSNEMQPMEDLWQYLRDYARAQPETAALVCLGVGFLLAWKLRIW